MLKHSVIFNFIVLLVKIIGKRQD